MVIKTWVVTANVDQKLAIASMERVPIRPFASITPSETSIDLHKENT